MFEDGSFCDSFAGLETADRLLLRIYQTRELYSGKVASLAYLERDQDIRTVGLSTGDDPGTVVEGLVREAIQLSFTLPSPDHQIPGLSFASNFAESTWIFPPRRVLEARQESEAGEDAISKTEKDSIYPFDVPLDLLTRDLYQEALNADVSEVDVEAKLLTWDEKGGTAALDSQAWDELRLRVSWDDVIVDRTQKSRGRGAFAEVFPGTFRGSHGETKVAIKLPSDGEKRNEILRHAFRHWALLPNHPNGGF